VSRQALAFAKAGFVYPSIDGPYCGARAGQGGFLFDGSHPRESRDRMIRNVLEMRRSVDLRRHHGRAAGRGRDDDQGVRLPLRGDRPDWMKGQLGVRPFDLAVPAKLKTDDVR
jgi:hypothetical protein